MLYKPYVEKDDVYLMPYDEFCAYQKERWDYIRAHRVNENGELLYGEDPEDEFDKTHDLSQYKVKKGMSAGCIVAIVLAAILICLAVTAFALKKRRPKDH